MTPRNEHKKERQEQRERAAAANPITQALTARQQLLDLNAAPAPLTPHAADMLAAHAAGALLVSPPCAYVARADEAPADPAIEQDRHADRQATLSTLLATIGGARVTYQSVRARGLSPWHRVLWFDSDNHGFELEASTYCELEANVAAWVRQAQPDEWSLELLTAEAQRAGDLARDLAEAEQHILILQGALADEARRRADAGDQGAAARIEHAASLHGARRTGLFGMLWAGGLILDSYEVDDAGSDKERHAVAFHAPGQPVQGIAAYTYHGLTRAIRDHFLGERAAATARIAWLEQRFMELDTGAADGI